MLPIINLNELREQRKNCSHEFNMSPWTCDLCGIDIEDTEESK